MTAILMDGFDHYGTGNASTSNLIAGPYAYANNVTCGSPSWGPPRTGSSCLSGPASGGGGVRRVLPTAGTHFFVSFGLAVDALVSDAFSAISFMDGSANSLVTLKWTSTGVLQLVQNGPSSSTVIAQTSGPVIVAHNWHFFEMEINTTLNTFTLRVDDAQAINAPVLTVTDARITGTIAQLGLLTAGVVTQAVTPYLDDLFVRDSTGTINNGWLGDRRVATLFANANTATSGWTPNYYKNMGAGILTLSYMQAGSNSVQNATAYLTVAPATALDIGATDFTLETWVRFDALPTSGLYSSIFSRWNVGVTNGRSYRLILGSQTFNNNCIQFDTSTDGTASTTVTKLLYPWTPVTDVWYHVALVRAAGELLLFVNGQQLGLPIADNQTYFSGGQETLSVGMEVPQVGVSPNATPGTNLIGRLDETRFTNGIGRYTGPFTVPATAFPRGAANDPNWSQVVLLMGYDGGIIDESSYNRVITNFNCIQFSPADGPALGPFSTVNKATPDDNTFIQAALTNASNILTMAVQPNNGDMVTVGTKDGTNAAVYVFKTTIANPFDVLIDTTAENTLLNLLNAINLGTGSGTKYGTGTTSNYNVNAVQLPVGQIEVLANTAGTIGNSIACSSTGTAAVWSHPTLTGGQNIPGPTNFILQRPPNNTTIISALQMNFRALKTDAGTATVQTSFIGALGGSITGSTHPLTVAPNYYSDILQTDPDTSGPLTPTTIVNGQFRINRTA